MGVPLGAIRACNLALTGSVRCCLTGGGGNGDQRRPVGHVAQEGLSVVDDEISVTITIQNVRNLAQLSI